MNTLAKSHLSSSSSLLHCVTTWYYHHCVNLLVRNILVFMQAPNPAATEFIPKGAPRMSTISQAAVPTFPSPLFSHPGLGGSAAAGLAPGESLSLPLPLSPSPHLLTRTIHVEFLKNHLWHFSSTGMSLSAGSSPLHSPKITPHTSPAPRRRSHTPNPNPANYMVPTTASEQGGAAHIIQKETVGGTTYFYTDNTPAPMAGMVRSWVLSP